MLWRQQLKREEIPLFATRRTIKGRIRANLRTGRHPQRSRTATTEKQERFIARKKSARRWGGGPFFATSSFVGISPSCAGASRRTSSEIFLDVEQKGVRRTDGEGAVSTARLKPCPDTNLLRCGSESRARPAPKANPCKPPARPSATAPTHPDTS